MPQARIAIVKLPAKRAPARKRKSGRKAPARRRGGAQDGGLSFRDVVRGVERGVRGVEKGVRIARRFKPITRIDQALAATGTRGAVRGALGAFSPAGIPVGQALVSSADLGRKLGFGQRGGNRGRVLVL